MVSKVSKKPEKKDKHDKRNDKIVTEVEIGDIVTMEFNGRQITVKGYLVSEYMPTEDEIRAIIVPLYPEGSGDVAVCRFGEIKGYQAPADGKYGDDSIFWGT